MKKVLSTSSNPHFTTFLCPQNPYNPSKFHFPNPLKSPHPPCHILFSSHNSSTSPILQENANANANSYDDDDDEIRIDEFSEEFKTAKKSLEELLVVRRPLMEVLQAEEEANVTIGQEEEEEEEEEVEEEEEEGTRVSFPSVVDAGLSNFAKKLTIFEPETADSSSAVERPLMVNLDLALHKAKDFTRTYRYQEAEQILQKCIYFWPEEGRAYVALGKVLCKLSRYDEARTVYERGCQATQGENAYIWQCWAVMENKKGNIRRARELFDAATVADKKHIAAWHGWAVLELKAENIKKARNLLIKGLKFCGGNEYIYQSLAMLEAKANRFDQARYLFRQATNLNPNSCASWLAWAQMEVRQENNCIARQLFEKAIQASPKNRFAWHVWGVFEANLGNVDRGRKLLRIGHALNPRDPVLLQSLGLLEYKYSTANLARMLFKKASELDPRHQPVWFAWGWMEWKEENITTARELYQRVLSIDSSTDTAARCLQAWGVLEQRDGNLSAARRLFRASLNVNSQSFVTWMTWASLEEDQGNTIRAEEIRNLYFQQRTEVVDDASWVTGVLDIIDPAIDSIKKLLNIDQNLYYKPGDSPASTRTSDNAIEDDLDSAARHKTESGSGFDLDAFIRTKLNLHPSKLDSLFVAKLPELVRSKLDSQLDAKLMEMEPRKSMYQRRVWRASKKVSQA